MKITKPFSASLLIFFLCACNNGTISTSISSSSSSTSSQSSSISSSSCTHHIVVDKGYDATCENAGLTDGSHCDKCNQIIEQQVTIPAKGHSYSLHTISVKENEVHPRRSTFYCDVCEKMSKRALLPSDINNIPILELNGDFSTISKENEIDITAIYDDGDKTQFELPAKIKWQGSSSIAYDKKNFNITFYNEKGKKNKVQIKKEWGKQNKYTLKANWVDFSQSRNVVSGQLFSEIVHSRDIEDDLNAISNGGVVDGFSIVIYINNAYQGLYTLNIPKNKWMFGMDGEDQQQALLMGDTFNDSIYLKAPVKYDYSNGWELEYCSTEDTTGTDWVADSMNELISFLATSSDTEFKNNIKDYILFDRTLDSMIYSWFICAGDNFAKNILWATYDGVKWYPSLYDLDGTWGMMYNGINYYSSDTFLPDSIVTQYNCNYLWQRLYTTCMKEIKTRYFQLRENFLTENYISNTFGGFLNKIPQILRTTEINKWPNSVNPGANNLKQIVNFAKNRIIHYDNFFNSK